MNALYWAVTLLVLMTLLATAPLVLPFLVATLFLVRLHTFVRTRAIR